MTKTTIDLTSAKRFLDGVPLPILAAVSGGRDSMCLLHFLADWGKAHHTEVTVAHFNHQLRGALADRDETFVKETCARLGIPCVCGRGDTRTYAEQEGLSLEEAARVLRYRFLEETRQKTGCGSILTAHHADDNAETVLLNLLRGTGIQGLTGIPAQRDHVFRPFLSVTRGELEQYAKENNIPFVEDETNELDDAARNVLRHQVLPVLKELNPRAVENITRTAKLLKQDARALELETGKVLHHAEVTPGVQASLPVTACKHQPKAVLSRVVLSLLVSVGGHQRDLTATHVEAVLDLLHGSPGREISLPYGMTARRTEEAVQIFCGTENPESCSIALGETVTFGEWTVHLGTDAIPGAYEIKEIPELTVTRWRPTDRFYLPGSRGARSLKRLCADAGIQPTERDAMPLLRVGEKAVVAPGIGVNLEYLPQGQDAVIYVVFNHKQQ